MTVNGWRPVVMGLVLCLTACAPSSDPSTGAVEVGRPSAQDRVTTAGSATGDGSMQDSAASPATGSVSAEAGVRLGAGRAILAATAGSTTVVATTVGVHAVIDDVPVPLEMGIDRATTIEVTPDGSRAVVSWADRTDLWRLDDPVERIDSLGPTSFVASTGDGHLLLVADGAFELRKAADGALVSRHEAPAGHRFGPPAVDPTGEWWAVPTTGAGVAIEMVVARQGGPPAVVSLGEADPRSVGQAALFPSSDTIVIGRSDNGDRFEGGELVAWEAGSGRLLWSRQLGPGQLWDIDGRSQLAIVGPQELTLLGPDGEERRTEPLPEGFPVSAVHGVASGGFAVVLQDGSRLVVAADGTVESQALELPRFALASQHSADRSSVSVVDHHGAITVLGPDARPAGRLDAFVAGVVNDIAISPTAQVALATSTGAIRLVDPDDPIGLAEPAPNELPHPEGTVDSVVFSPDGHRLITGVAERRSAVVFDDTVAVWDLAERRRIVEIGGGREEVQDCSSFFNVLRLASDGSFVVGVSHDFTVFVLDGETYERRLTLPPHAGPVLDIALSPDDGSLVTTAQDSTVRVWDPGSGELQAEYAAPLGGYRSIDFLPDGSGLVAADFTGSLTIIETLTGATRSTFESSVSGAADVEISPDGRLVASGDGPILRLWSVETGAVVGEYVGHSGSVTTAAFGSDSATVISGSADGTAMLWDLGSM